jgi:hypothetical protein
MTENLKVYIDQQPDLGLWAGAAVVAVIVVGVLAFYEFILPAGAKPPSTPELVLATSTVMPGQGLAWAVTGFPPSTAITVGTSSSPSSATTDVDGNASGIYETLGLAPGNYELIAVDPQNASISVQKPFTVELGTPPLNPSVVITSPIVFEGSVLGYIGTGFTPNGGVGVEVQGSGLTVEFNPTAAGPTGSLIDSFTVGANVPEGNDTLVLTDLVSGEKTSATFVVVPALP